MKVFGFEQRLTCRSVEFTVNSKTHFLAFRWAILFRLVAAETKVKRFRKFSRGWISKLLQNAGIEPAFCCPTVFSHIFSTNLSFFINFSERKPFLESQWSHLWEISELFNSCLNKKYHQLSLF